MQNVTAAQLVKFATNWDGTVDHAHELAGDQLAEFVAAFEDAYEAEAEDGADENVLEELALALAALQAD